MTLPFGIYTVTVSLLTDLLNFAPEGQMMNRTSQLFAIAAFALLSSHSSADPQASRRIRVLCYNIHYGQGTDGKYDIRRLADVINRTQPDLVALQEVDVGVERSGRVHEAQRLEEFTGLDVRMGPTQHYEGGLFGNAVLSKFPIQDVVIHPLPYTPSTPERTTYPRGAIAVTVKVADGIPLRLISTHFQHNVAEDRLAEAKQINRLFGKQTDRTATILAGDMNATPSSAPIAELGKHWTNAIDDDSLPTAPATKPTSRIDYVFYRPTRRFRMVSSEVVPESVASDHRPVLAVFEILE